MKYLSSIFYLLFGILLGTIELNAQVATKENIKTTSPTSKGNWLIGGELQLNELENTFSFTNNQIQIAPSAGYFLINRLLLGAGISINQTRFTGLADEKYKSTIFQVTPFLRYYIGNQKIKPYLQLEGVFTSLKNTSSFQSNSFENNALFGQIGFEFFLSNNTALNFNLSGLIAGDPEDSRIFNDILRAGSSDRIVLGAGINFYLMGKEVNTTDTPLLDRYFKKGNKTIGLAGRVNFNPFILLGSIHSKKFINVKTRRNFLIDTVFGKETFGGDFKSVVLFRPEIERFIKLDNRFFFAPSIGVGVLASSAGSDTDILVNTQLYPKFIYFAKKLFLDVGFQINTPFTDFSNANNERWAGNVILGGDYFIQNNLSLRGEFFLRTFGRQQFNFKANPLYELLSKNIFKIGINYFIERA